MGQLQSLKESRFLLSMGASVVVFKRLPRVAASDGASEFISAAGGTVEAWLMDRHCCAEVCWGRLWDQPPMLLFPGEVP